MTRNVGNRIKRAAVSTVLPSPPCRMRPAMQKPQMMTARSSAMSARYTITRTDWVVIGRPRDDTPDAVPRPNSTVKRPIPDHPNPAEATALLHTTSCHVQLQVKVTSRILPINNDGRAVLTSTRPRTGLSAGPTHDNRRQSRGYRIINVLMPPNNPTASAA